MKSYIKERFSNNKAEKETAPTKIKKAAKYTFINITRYVIIVIIFVYFSFIKEMWIAAFCSLALCIPASYLLEIYIKQSREEKANLKEVMSLERDIKKEERLASIREKRERISKKNGDKNE